MDWIFSQNPIELSNTNLFFSNQTTEFQPSRMVKSLENIIILDTYNQKLAVWNNDSLSVKWGYGAGNDSFFDPVGIISNYLDILILDRSKGIISRFDSKLNFIQSISVDKNGYMDASLFSIDSYGNIYFYSKSLSAIYRSETLTGEFSLFLDLSANFKAFDCLLDFKFLINNEFAILFDCSKEVWIYSRSGKLIRRHLLSMKNPSRVIPFNKTWLVFNEVGDFQSLDSSSFKINTSNGLVRDAFFDKGLLYVLTRSKIITLTIEKN